MEIKGDEKLLIDLEGPDGSILDLYSLYMFIINYRNHRYAMIMLIKFPASSRRPDIRPDGGGAGYLALRQSSKLWARNR